MTKERAWGEVASAFGRRDTRPLKNWKKKAEKLFGSAVVREALMQAEAAGRRYRDIRDGLSRGTLKEPAVAREVEYWDRWFGDARLEAIAEGYKKRERKRHKKKRRDTI